LSRLKAEISETHSIVRAKRNSLITEEYALLNEMRRYKGVISPIRRLPPEIIGAIFLYLAPVLGSNHQLRRRGPLELDRVPRVRIPWHLGHICRYWRAVALSTRSLWSV
ncbi:hypothetical protein B0H19DRAFT_905164, partial [Mycena capillaripes]